MWSFVGNKGNKQWIWLAMDVGTREIVGLYVGSRDREGALGTISLGLPHIKNGSSTPIGRYGLAVEAVTRS